MFLLILNHTFSYSALYLPFLGHCYSCFSRSHCFPPSFWLTLSHSDTQPFTHIFFELFILIIILYACTSFLPYINSHSDWFMSMLTFFLTHTFHTKSCYVFCSHCIPPSYCDLYLLILTHTNLVFLLHASHFDSYFLMLSVYSALILPLI